MSQKFSFLKHFIPIVFTLELFSLSLLNLNCHGKQKASVPIDLKTIRARGKLKALTGYNATSYFIYKGQPMGYEYELLTLLARHLGLELEIVVENNLEKMFQRLDNGEGDLISFSLTVTRERKKHVDFTDQLFTTRQVLVQRKPPGWRRMKLHEIDNMLIENPIELIGKKVYVVKNSSHFDRLKHLSDEIGGEIKVVTVGGDTTTEQLIEMVSRDRINYTLADRHIALINQAYFNNLDVSVPISLPQRIAWAVRKTSPHLLQLVNQWILEMKKSAAYYVIYNKYFKNRTAFVHRAKSGYLSVTGGKISIYDEIIKQQAKPLGWDWRLLASLIYQESQFDPTAKSWAGAVGLMQILPDIGKKFGATDLRKPGENISAGVKYLRWLDDYWKKIIPDSAEQVNLVLASFNVGIGHVQDARRLAEKYGRNPDIWKQNVEYYLWHLSEKKYYLDEVAAYGYCRGVDPVNYVKEILERYAHYRQMIAN